MSLNEKLQIAVLVVAIVGAIAALLQPSIRRINRVLATLVLVGVVVWLVITIAGSNGVSRTVTEGTGTPDSFPTPTTVRTITYPAPPEPVPGTSATTGTTSTMTAITTPQPAPQPAITATIPHPQPVVEPAPFTPQPVIPQPQPVAPQQQPVPDPRVALEQEWNRAIALSDSQQWREAASAWERLLRDHSGRNRAFDSGVWHRLGIAYEALSEWSKAATAFQQANLNDDRNNATSDLRHMGHCYISLGRRSEAMDIYRRLLAIDPGDKASRDLLSVLSRQR